MLDGGEGARRNGPIALEAVINIDSNRPACEWKEYQTPGKTAVRKPARKCLLEIGAATERPSSHRVLSSLAAEKDQDMDIREAAVVKDGSWGLGTRYGVTATSRR